MAAEQTPAFDELTARLIAFRDARDWRRFHSLKNLILSVIPRSAAHNLS